MEPRLIQQQTQRLILSPQIRQYLRLLQMPLIALEQAVEVELSENPLLEEKQATEAEKAEEISLQGDPVEAIPDEKVKDANTDEFRAGEFEHFLQLDDNFRENYYDSIDFSIRNVSDLEKQKNFQDSLITKPEALADYLMWQIRLLDMTDTERKITEEIVGNIDEDGYLKAGIEEVAEATNEPPQAVEKVLGRLHEELEPPGMGARDLQEALILQLRRKGPDAHLALEIVSKHLPLLGKRDFQHLSRLLSVDVGEIKKAVAVIGRLEPRPGRTFYVEEPIAVTPDATVSFNENEGEDGAGNKFKIEIHDETIPKLRINSYYRRLLRDKGTDEKTKFFLREKMQHALNFLKALKLRKSTIREITEEIVKVQSDFFENGFAYLRPLRLKDIANTLGIHESTVSRALHGKYISTPQGTISYKNFFSTKLETTNGEWASQKSIMEKIRRLIHGEGPKKPLSDQEIGAILQKDGIVIARRTVAKYRDLLKILPSHLRRQR